MDEMGYARSYRDLIVYREARSLAKRVFELSKTFPAEERYSLTDQVRRSSRSIGAQIAEAWAKRRYERHFVSKLTDADGEQQETQHWIETAHDCAYVSAGEKASLLASLAEIGKMLSSMIRKSASFCASPDGTVREEATEYFTSADDIPLLNTDH